MGGHQSIQNLSLLLTLFALAISQFGQTAIAEERSFQLRGIIGEDNRVPMDSWDPPWNAVGKIFIQAHGSVGDCTGTLVAPNLVATAAHCVYNWHEKGTYPPQFLHFLAGYRKEKYIAHTTGKCIKVSPEYTDKPRAFQKEASVKEVTADYAFVVLKDPIDVPPIPILDAAHFTTQDLLTHAGYCCDRRYLLSVHKNCKAFYKHEGAYFADCDSAEGASGGPIFVKRNGKYYIVAVHSASGFQFDTPDGKIKLNAMTSILHERHNLEELAKCEKEE